MSAAVVIGKFAMATSAALELITALNQAAIIMNARQARGGDYTPEEIAQIDAALDQSEVVRNAAIAKARS